MAAELPTLGEFEMQVLRHVWQDQPCTDRQVWQRVQRERHVARTTVLKTMQRLESKGLLERVRGTSPVQFRAALDANRVLPELVERFVDGVLGGSAEPLVAYLAGSQKLSARDIAALQAIVKRIRAQESSGDAP